ncbi:hypothetical protein [Acinetobacter larvae]|uniref:Uncharacterized protein n=1 Tax=Acinetobacter larvae TaxID=1789224 RepID=A0A1B2LX80_9GAMM|nr:hypothetical protein [Acinetobacter larvae]AOA57558.1 hypothetical protein BFG52_03785 [Acinetobacter larvae]
MSEKNLTTITHRCSYEEKDFLEAIAKVEGKSLSELIRENNMVRISAEKERLNHLASLMCLTTSTVSPPNFELSPPPRPKTTGTKKAQLCDQLSLICHTNELI